METSTAKKVFKNIYWSYLLTIISSIYGFVTVPLLLNYFGEQQYGLINLAISMNVYIQLLDMGVSGTNVRFFATWLAEKKYKKVATLFSTSFSYLTVIGLINAIFLFILSLYAGDWFSLTYKQAQVMQKLLYILMFNAILSWSTSVFDQIIKAGEHIAWLQKRAFIPLFIQILSVILTLSFNLSLQIYFLLTISSTLFIIPFSLFKLKKEYHFLSFKPSFNFQIIREILSYSIGIFSFGIFQYSMQNLRPIILGVQSDLSSVADYKIMLGIVGVVLSISGNFFSILLPTSSRIMSQGNREVLDMISYKGTKYITILLSFLIFGGILVSSPLISLYVGEKYSYLSFWLSIWLLSLFVNHNQAISSLVFSQTNLKPIAYMSCFSMVLGLSFSWFLTPYYKVGGVVLGYMIYALFQTLFYYIYYWPQYMGINSFLIFKRSFLPPFLVGGISCLLLLIIFRFIHCGTFGEFIISGFIYVLLFSTLLYKFVLDSDDINFLRNLVSRKR